MSTQQAAAPVLEGTAFHSNSPSPTPSVSSHSSRISISTAATSTQSRSPTRTRSFTNRDPMASVDLSAIHAAMKMASLDQHRGYAQDHYGEVKQDHATQYVDQDNAAGYQVIREPLWNKGKSQYKARNAAAT